MQKRANKTPSKKRKKFLLILLVIITIGAVGIFIYSTRHKDPAPATVATKNGTKPVKNASTTKEKSPTVSNSANQGHAEDNNGQSGQISTSPDQWATSTSKNITLKQPIAQSTFKSGDVISGSATVSQVQYRLIDNQVGVVAQGFLNVVGGNFSGTMQFTPHGSSGRLDVFSTTSGGVEINEVQVALNF